MGDNEGDGKFGFSRRTRVDDGGTGEPPEDAGPPEVYTPVDEEDLHTGALSVEELEEAGIIAGERGDEKRDGTVAETPGLVDDEVEAARSARGDTVADMVVPFAQADGDADGALSTATYEGIAVAEDESSGDFGQATMMLESTDGEATAAGGGLQAGDEPTMELVILAGKDKGSAFKVGGQRLLVGRSLDCDIVLNDASVSRRHFQLVRTIGGYDLEDLGSGNGTAVDGKKQPQVRLTDGMVIEVGTTRLMWRCGADTAPDGLAGAEDDEGDMTRVGQLAVMPPAQHGAGSDRQVPQRTPEPPRISAPPSRSQATRETRALAVRRVALASACIIVAGTAFVVLDSVAGWGVLGDTQSTAEADVQKASGAAQTAMAHGLEAFKARQWHDARSRFRRALELDPSLAGATDALARVRSELDAGVAIEDGRKALEEGQFKETMDRLAKIPDTSVYYSEAKDMHSQAREDLVDFHLDAAGKLEEDRRVPMAIKQVEMALAIASGNTDALALLEELKQAEETPEVAAPVKVASKPGKKRATAARGQGISFARGKSLYGAGNFSMAASFFDQASRTAQAGPDRKKAKRLATAVRDFAGHWEAGKASAARGRSRSAAANLKKALRIDARINGAYQSRLKTLMATLYADLANTAYRAGNFGTAGGQARKALSYDRGQAVATMILAEVQKKAEAWLGTSRTLARSNPDKAMGLLNRVLAVFPRSDARYKEAYVLLNSLGDEGDD